LKRPHRAFFYSLHLPLLRVLLPITLVVLFLATTLLVMDHRSTGGWHKLGVALVMIDPGHGGYDPGVLQGDLREADIVLSIAKELQKALEARGIPAMMTRETDTDFAERGMKGKSAKRADLSRRVEMTQRANASVFVSLHANASPLASRGGAEVFYNQSDGAKELAERIQKELHKLPGMSKREAHAADYFLLRNLDIPALIVECGYLNFPDERQRLLSPTYQAKIAAAVADGIMEYLIDQ
jgi:N-acetylmuramoyl-L-alanine amidase